MPATPHLQQNSKWQPGAPKWAMKSRKVSLLDFGHFNQYPLNKCFDCLIDFLYEKNRQWRKNRKKSKYQPSSAGGTRSLPKTSHSLEHPTACKIKNGLQGGGTFSPPPSLKRELDTLEGHNVLEHSRKKVIGYL